MLKNNAPNAETGREANRGIENESWELLLQESALKGSRRSERYPGRSFFGYFCSYFPEELIIAAGMEPLRLLPASANAAPAELPAYCCSLARGTLAQAGKGEFRDLAGVGFAHTCDTMQCLGGIWESAVDRERTLILVPPVMFRAPGAVSYYRAELEGLAQRLSALSGVPVTEKGLREAWELCEKARFLAGELDELRPGLPSPWTAAALRAGQLMPRGNYIKALSEALPDLKQFASRADNRPGILLSGAMLENDALFQMIEDLGGRIVAEDTCSGYRHFARSGGQAESHPASGGLPEGGAGDFLERIARRYLEMPPCPCRNRGLEERSKYLAGLARQYSAAGVILAIRKYCEPHAWDSVHLLERLRAEGLRTLVLELEGAEPGGQERTRVQAFLESL